MAHTAAGAPLTGAILGVLAYRIYNLWLPPADETRARDPLWRYYPLPMVVAA